MSELPPGFVLDQPATPVPSTAELPPGFVLDQPNVSAPDQRSVLDRLIGAGGERYQTWPERMARDFYARAVNAAAAPGRALRGELTPEEEIRAAGDYALTFGALHLPPGLAGGEAAIPGMARNAPAAEPLAAKQAAETALEAGGPLPAGLATPNLAVQALTQRARQLPIVGQAIDQRLRETIGKAGEAVSDIGEELGAQDRSAAGAILRPSLRGVIETNNGRIDDAFSQLRGMLDQSEPIEIPRTEAVLKAIQKERSGAGEDPAAGLGNVQRLVDQGATFDNLQRARSTIANSINYGEANPGFNVGDLKRLATAMKSDMDLVARQSARPGVSPDAISRALADANATAAPLFDANKMVERLLGLRSDEGVVGSVIRAGQEKTGNVKLLAQLRNTMPAEDFQMVAGTGLNELGHNAATGEFSLNQFATNWNKLGERAKGILFTPGHKAFLDRIAGLGEHLKATGGFANVSGTAGAAMTGYVVGSLGHGFAALLTGNPLPLLKELGALGGGYALGKFLARPAGAAAMARWTRALELQRLGPSPARIATLKVTTQDLLTNLADTLRSDNVAPTAKPVDIQDQQRSRLRVSVPVPFGARQ